MSLRNIRKENGFTLVELMVAVAIGLIVMAAIYSVYRTQQKSYILQEQVAGMQQNLRAALFYMAREIRMAGCDPTRSAGTGITTATSNSFGFTCDIRGDALGSEFDGAPDDPNENVTYSLYDAQGDGDLDIGRNTGGGNQALAENIDALDFVYLASDGITTTTTISQIRAVQITIVARTGRGDPGYTNNDGEFRNQQNQVIYTAPNDNFHRRMLSTHVRLRNL